MFESVASEVALVLLLLMVGVSVVALVSWMVMILGCFGPLGSLASEKFS